MRVFVAVPLDAATITQLKKMQQTLQRSWKSEAVRWVTEDQMHLTLKFFGNVPADQIADLAETIRRIGRDFPPFQLRAERAGCFPDFKRPRVVWVGLSGDLEPLRRLQARVEQETGAWGDHQESRSFQPHLTLGRVKSTRPGDLAPVGEKVQALAQVQFGAWTVGELKLMQSQLSPSGAVYTVLADILLGSPCS